MGLTVGNEYIIENIGKGRKLNSGYFKGRFIGENDYFYIFKSRHKYCECFLKVDFIINYYSIKETLSKAC